MSCEQPCSGCARLRVAALQIVGEEGLDGLTFNDLCARAGMAPDVVRGHYPTVQSCLHETYDEVAYSIYEDFAACFAAEDDRKDALRLAAHTLLERMARRPDEARMCFVEVLRGDHELLRRRDANRRRLLALFERELLRGCERPESFRTQLELLVGAAFQTIAATVETGELVEQVPELEAELETRAYVFQPAIA